MGWNINTFNNKYQIKYRDNPNYLITSNDISYLSITNDKHIGINNEFPNTNYLLDINGITHINSNFYVDGYSYFSSNIYVKDNIYVDQNIHIKENIITSNIIGGSYHNTSNIIKLNNTNNYSNNIVEIYGKTSLFGLVYINKDDNTKPPTQNDYLLDINGSLRANKIYGDGTNINNLNANNISSGIIPISQGGTGLNILNNNQLLYSTVQINSSGIETYSINQSPNLVFNGDKLTCKVSASVIQDGTVSVARGGTNKGSFNKGLVLFGNDDVDIQSTDDFKFENRTLKIVELEIKNEKIKVNTNGALRNLNASDIGIGIGSTTTLGLIKILSEDFELNPEGFLKLKAQANTWTNVSGTPNNISKIHFPSLLKYRNADQQSYVGINIIDPKYDLDVRGTINSSNINSSNYTLNGINLETSLLEKAATESRKTAIDYIKDLDLISSNILKGDQSIFQKGTAVNTYNRGALEDVWKINKDSPDRFETVNINITNLCRINRLEIYNNDTVTAPQTANEKEIFNITTTQGDSLIKKLLKFTKAGNLLIGDNLDIPSSTYPPERLTIKGNISASGHIRSYYSDSRLKTLTSNITDALNIIDSLNGFYYVPNEKALQLGFEYDNEIGLSAQEVKKVIPEIVKVAPFDMYKSNDKIISKSGEQYLTICYERLGAVFVEAIKELRKENISLKSEINVLKKDIDNMKKLIYIN